ncbi:MAG: dihydroorotase [Porticoccaceae bacterium]
MDSSSLTLTRPDDWHLHLRDDAALQHTVPNAARQFGRGIVMPNLATPVATTEQALSYRERILAQRPTQSSWQPLMTLYLTDNTSAAELKTAKDSGLIHGIKYYPAGATTNSDAGVTKLEGVYHLLEQLQSLGLPLLVHGEVTDSDVDIFDREAVFIDRHLAPLARAFPELAVVMEHITTREGADFVRESPAHIAATITPQHLLYNRNHLLVGGIRPHLYCLPILKRDIHQQALLQVATSGNPSFFLGTDSAPHPRSSKESACGCAGCYSHHAAMELYAEAFEREGALDKLEGFASHHGADFYGLPYNDSTITLVRESWQAPHSIAFGDTELSPLAAGDTLQWKMLEGQSLETP